MDRKGLLENAAHVGEKDVEHEDAPNENEGSSNGEPDVVLPPSTSGVSVASAPKGVTTIESARQTPVTSSRNPSFLAPLNPSIRRAYATELRFWTVWRVLGVMFGGIFGASLLVVLSLVSVLESSWSVDSIGIMNLGIMTVLCACLMGVIIFSIVRFAKNAREERTFEQIWVLLLCGVCWLQPYLNPIAIGFRWSKVSQNWTTLETVRGYTIDDARISGFSSTLLVTSLYAFCSFEIQRFREERIRNRRKLVTLYFVIRMCFTQAVAMDMGSVPIAQLFTLMRFQPTPDLPVARVCGVVIVATIDLVVWIMNIIYHRNTRVRMMYRMYDDDEKARSVQYGLSIVTTAMWTSQIVFACVVVVCTPPSRLNSQDLSFSGTSVNTIGCCCAFLLVAWMLAIVFANFPIRQEENRVQHPKKRDRFRTRVRFYNFEKEVPAWAVLVVNGRRCFPAGRSSVPTPLGQAERQNSVTSSQDAAEISLNPKSLSRLAKSLLSRSFSTVGEALAPDGTTLVLNETESQGTVVNFVLEHACSCLNFANVVYLTGNYLKPQTNAQVQLLVEDSRFTVYRQVSSPQLDVHATVFVSNQLIIVGFRGTHSSQNLLTDASFHWKDHHNSIDWEYASNSVWARRFTPKIHAGFKKAYATLRIPLLACLEELLEQDQTRAVRLCGHSMGGSLACLFALDLRKKLVSDPSRITVFTFGSSRLGNESFRVRYNDAVPQTFSIFCAGDPVSKLPPRFPFGLPLGYKHHGIAVMLLPNGSVLVRPSRAELAVLHTYAPNDWSVHRVRSFAHSFMKFCVVKGIDSQLRPFWNSTVIQIQNLPFTMLRHPLLLKYLLQEDAEAVLEAPWLKTTSAASKEALLGELTKALTKYSYKSQQKAKTGGFALGVSVSALRIPLSRAKSAHPFLSSKAMSTKQLFSDLISRAATFKRDVTESPVAPSTSPRDGHSRSISTGGQSAHDGAEDESPAQPLVTIDPNDAIFVGVSCGAVEEATGEEDDTVDAPEQNSNEVLCGSDTWVAGLDKPLMFGGSAQTIRPEVDRLTFKVFRRATECSHETGIISKIMALPNTASNVLQHASSALLATNEVATNQASEQSKPSAPAMCEVCSSPVCIARCELPVSSLFEDLTSIAPSPKEIIISALPVKGLVLKENFVLKLNAWLPDDAAHKNNVSSPVAIKSPTTEAMKILRTAGDMPLYDPGGLMSRTATTLFPNGFTLRVRLVRAVGAPYRAVKSPMYRLGEYLSNGVYCKVSMSGQSEKYLSPAKRGKRIAFQNAEEVQRPPLGPSRVAGASIFENVTTMTAHIKSHKVLQVEFGQDIYVFGEKQQHLSGFEEVFVRVHSTQNRIRLKLRREEMGGYVVADVHKALNQLYMDHQRRHLPGDSPMTYARWFPLRGPNACGKILVAMEFVAKTTDEPKKTSVPSGEEFLDAEEDIVMTSPMNALRLDRPVSTRSPHYKLELVLSGLRYLPAEFNRVAMVVEVRDEYNPRHGVKVRSAWIEYSGVVSGWSFQPQRLAMGSDPASRLEGSEQIILRLVNASDATIAKREFRLRDLLADYAESGEANDESALISLLAWFVMPYKSLVNEQKDVPEVKVLIEIKSADHYLPVTALSLV